jgi:hypothetical protein
VLFWGLLLEHNEALTQSASKLFGDLRTISMATLTAPVRLADRLTTEERFQRLAAEWKELARYMSDSRRMVMLRPYQAIIGMGLPIVPLILEDLKQKPHQWFWALEMITDANPV